MTRKAKSRFHKTIRVLKDGVIRPWWWTALDPWPIAQPDRGIEFALMVLRQVKQRAPSWVRMGAAPPKTEPAIVMDAEGLHVV